jgi:hypothetical protein
MMIYYYSMIDRTRATFPERFKLERFSQNDPLLLPADEMKLIVINQSRVAAEA